MNWDNAQLVDQLCYDMVLADWPRSQNRRRIQDLANGDPPYTDEQAEENNIEVNINDLSHTRLAHDARSQFNNAFMKTGNFATARTDLGPVSKRSEYGAIVTREWNRPMKRSIPYFEANRAKFGQNVLHGIAPSVWENEDSWCTRTVDIGDVLIPGKTLLGFQNLPFFAVRRSFTGIELEELTRKSVRDPGWNMEMVDAALAWIDEATTTLMGNNWPEVWSPEKVAERRKEGGYLASDNCPTLECFDVYGYIGDDPETGWVRRIILDSWSTPTLTGINSYMMSRKKGYGGQDGVRSFLFTSRDRKVAQSWQNIVGFQFADLSAVFPARYHSVRGLAWMTFASCFLGNRMRCKFYEAVLEALMQYFKVRSADDVQRALKLNLVNRGFIDDTIKPVPAAERWQVNAQLVELGLADNLRVTQENAASWVQNQNYSRDRTEKTKFQVMAELNAMTSLVSAALNQAYQYQNFEDREIFRRFCKKNSGDIDVRKYQAACLRQGVPEDLLHNPDAWDIEHERVYGGGNKTMEMQVASWLMEQRDKFDPEPQRKILRDAVLAFTDDAPLSNELVPEEPVKITDSVHDAQNSVGSLMALEDMQPKTGQNHIEIIETLLHSMTQRVARVL